MEMTRKQCMWFLAEAWVVANCSNKERMMDYIMEGWRFPDYSQYTNNELEEKYKSLFGDKVTIITAKGELCY